MEKKQNDKLKELKFTAEDMAKVGEAIKAAASTEKRIADIADYLAGVYAAGTDEEKAKIAADTGASPEELTAAAERLKARYADVRYMGEQGTLNLGGVEGTELPVYEERNSPDYRAKFFKANSRVLNVFNSLEFGENQVGKYGKDSSEIVTVTLEYSKNFIGGARLTVLDKMVMDAVSNCVLNGVHGVTAKTLFYISGRGNGLVSKRDIEAIENTINKLRLIHVTIDDTAESGKKSPEVASDLLDGFLLQGLRRVILYKNGTKKEGWLFEGLPMLFQYSRRNNQVVSIPRAVLLAGDIKDTLENRILRFFLIQTVIRLKRTQGKKFEEKETSVDSLFTELTEGENLTPNAMRKRKERILKNAIKILEGWVSIGWISGWRKATGIKGGLNGFCIEAGEAKKDKTKKHG